MTAPADSAGLWHNRSFGVYWFGQALSTLGDAFAVVALPLLVLQTTGSVIEMGLLSGTAAAASLVAGVTSGVLVDRYDRRRLMILCDAGRALVWCAVPVAWLLSGPQIWLLYVAAVASAWLGNTFQIACVSAIPSLVERGQVTRANGALQATFALMSLIGPLLSGLVCQRLGPVIAVAINAGSFVLSASSLVFVTLRRAAPPGGGAPDAARLADVLAGVRFLAREPVLRAMTAMLMVGALLYGGYRDVVIYHVKHVLQRPDGDVGVLLGLASLGGVAGGLSAAALRRRLGSGACWLAAWLVFGASLALAGAIGSFAAMCAFGTIIGFTIIVHGVISMSLPQEVTPDHLLGRVSSAYWTLANVLRPASAALTALLAARVGAPHTLVLVGGANVVLALAGLFTPVRAASSPRAPALPGA